MFGLLEEVGVMARISYVFDNTMGKLGLQGKSVMPFLVSFGCTMGGAAGARCTLDRALPEPFDVCGDKKIYTIITYERSDQK